MCLTIDSQVIGFAKLFKVKDHRPSIFFFIGLLISYNLWPQDVLSPLMP